LWSFEISLFSRRGIVSPTPNPQAGGPPFAVCPRLLIHYFRTYPPYLEGVSSIRNLRTRRAVMTSMCKNGNFVFNLNFEI
jgi:hypothetical protein